MENTERKHPSLEAWERGDKNAEMVFKRSKTPKYHKQTIKLKEPLKPAPVALTLKNAKGLTI